MYPINEKVHELYWEKDINCAGTMLMCLGELFHVVYEPQVLNSAVGMHGAGGYRAQCGLVEGALMFIGIYFAMLKVPNQHIVSECFRFAEEFDREFGSLQCFHLRPTGFGPDDPPHMCEQLTCRAIAFANEFIKNAVRADRFNQ